MARSSHRGAAAPPSDVRGVIFDLGGTLVHQNADPEPDRERRQCAAIARLASRELGCRDPEALAKRLLALRNEHGSLVSRDLVERPARETIAAGLREAGAAPGEGFVDRAERLLFEPDRGRRPYAGARELLETLRGRGLRIGLISNWSSHWIVTDIVAGAGIRDYFAPLVSSASFGRIKPHPLIFRHVLDAWGIGPEQAVMLGDTLDTDILGASRIGMRSVLVEIEPNPANAACEPVIRPTFRVRSLLDIPALLGS
jgi:HAD superfamily hydrolase (TIGR01509 family)